MTKLQKVRDEAQDRCKRNDKRLNRSAILKLFGHGKCMREEPLTKYVYKTVLVGREMEAGLS